PTCPRRCRPVGLAKWRTHLEPADQAVLSHSLETSTSCDASIATEKRYETEHVWLWIVYLPRRPLSLGAKDNVPTLCVLPKRCLVVRGGATAPRCDPLATLVHRERHLVPYPSCGWAERVLSQVIDLE